MVCTIGTCLPKMAKPGRLAVLPLLSSYRLVQAFPVGHESPQPGKPSRWGSSPRTPSIVSTATICDGPPTIIPCTPQRCPKTESQSSKPACWWARWRGFGHSVISCRQRGDPGTHRNAPCNCTTISTPIRKFLWGHTRLQQCCSRPCRRRAIWFNVRGTRWGSDGWTKER